MGQLRRFFALPEEINGNKIFLASEYRHIAKVLRLRPGNEVVVTTGDGVDHFCRIESIGSDVVELSVTEFSQNPAELAADVTLFQGVIKGSGMDWLTEKAVELGVNGIVPFVSEHTVADCGEAKAQRLTKIAREATKQCGRARIVNVGAAVSFKQMCGMLGGFDDVIFCNERGGKPLSKASLGGKKIAVIVGSEGGFSQNEAQTLSELAQSVTLGKRILRAETAGIYALSVIAEALNV